MHEVVDGGQAAILGFQSRAAGEQALCVGMLGVAEYFEHWGVFDFFAAEHDEHIVSNFGDDAEVVRDEDNRHAAVVAELAEDFQNFGLDGDVECRRRFIGNEKFWIAGEGHRDHDALLLAARHLMGIGIHALLGILDFDFAKQLDRFCACFGLADVLVEDNRLHDLCADREDRIERRHRLLKDHADVAAADRLHLAFGQLHQVFAEKSDAAAFRCARSKKAAA